MYKNYKLHCCFARDGPVKEHTFAAYPFPYIHSTYVRSKAYADVNSQLQQSNNNELGEDTQKANTCNVN